jgi:hypothetical protein
MYEIRPKRRHRDTTAKGDSNELASEMLPRPGGTLIRVDGKEDAAEECAGGDADEPPFA